MLYFEFHIEDGSNSQQIAVMCNIIIMGNSKSQEYSSLIKNRQINQWTVLDDCGSYQLWQEKNTHKRFMTYALDVASTNSEEKLQLFNFRKLNHAHLVTIQHLLTQQSEFLCSQPKNWHLLVENIPFRLQRFRRALNFREALTVLASAFAGYHILYYIYGPLYTSQDMICFNELGIPKVWVNQNLSLNEPSRKAKGDHEDAILDQLKGIKRYQMSNQEKVYNCVRKLLMTVQKAMIHGYTRDFKMEIGEVKSFAEGEEFIQNYCRRKGIQLEDTVSIEKVNQVEALHLKTQSYLNSDRLSQNVTLPYPSIRIAAGTPFNSQHNRLQTSSNHHSQMIFQPVQSSTNAYQQAPLRLSLNSNNRINIVYRQTQGSINHISKPLLSQGSNRQTSTTLPVQQKNIRVQPAVPIPVPTKNQQKIEQSPKQQSNQFIQNFKHDVVNSIESRQEILHTNIAQSKQIGQEQREYQYVVHQAKNEEDKQDIAHPLSMQSPKIDRVMVDPSESHLVHSDKQSQKYENSPQPQVEDELQLWQQSLLRLSAKQKKTKPQYKSDQSEQDQYLSQQRDKVFINSSNKNVPNFSNQNQLEAYIRSKYSEYIGSDKKIADSTEQITPYAYSFIQQSIEPYSQPYYRPHNYRKQSDSQHQINEKYRIDQENMPVSGQFCRKPSLSKKNGRISLNIKNGGNQHVIAENTKYTFGKIQIQPTSAYEQYSKARANQYDAENQEKTSLFKPIKKVSQSRNNAIEQRYNKYVKNRQSGHLGLSKDISIIHKKNEQDSSRNISKREYLLNEYINTSKNQDEYINKSSRNSDRLTYDHLRSFLWS